MTSKEWTAETAEEKGPLMPNGNTSVTLPPLLATAATSLVVSEAFPTREESVCERLEKWIFRPLDKMQGDQGFLVLMGLLPLYERCLREETGMGSKEKFTEGHQVFLLISNDLGIRPDEAYRFWQGTRNTLMHWLGEASISPSNLNWGIIETGPMIEFKADRFWINPFKLRDRLRERILKSAETWNNRSAFLPITCHRTK